MRDAYVNTVWLEHPVDFSEHLLSGAFRAVSADEGVKERFIDYTVEESIFVMQIPHVHLLEN